MVHRFAWIGSEFLAGRPTGIVLRFPGLSVTKLKLEADPTELEWGHHGALVVVPYHDPWGWTNARVVAFVDDLVAGIRARYELGEEVPVVATGASMGGHAALLYAVRSRHAVAACVANCPICDLPRHYATREDLARTMHHAFGSYGDNIDEALRAHSPLHQAGNFPDIPYLLIQGELDQCLKKDEHADRLVATLRDRGLRVEYLACPRMRHMGPLDHFTNRRIVDFVVAQLGAPVLAPRPARIDGLTPPPVPAPSARPIASRASAR